MKVIVNIEGSKDDLKIILQVLRDNMDYANSNDTFRLYMENDQPGGEIFEERYDENDNLVERRRH
ncbi:MAG: hypothetical protein HXX08_13295 [Chloroflexi bacterium]|uniref:Uncharacterized protein n=1 Tax=Candidatus Chlorohelix allophototropha TaxID=3003348 RepID=A0A8T7M425_9CHLR|nr:hypothetical protein [Chloroflexota bacterium]WJW70178.1 hypothetical protein OZ401_004686 [Chloroflexota bacterium L227-S17]